MNRTFNNILWASLASIVALWVWNFCIESDQVFTSEELSKYNGAVGSGKLYLAVLGEVFDVTKGEKHYGREGGYRGFVARDATRAFITGKFDEDLNDNIEDFTADQLKSLFEWRDFYRKDYVPKGKVVGAYYTADGKKTAELLSAEEKASSFQAAERGNTYFGEPWTPCNVRWSRDSGGLVWCDEDKGYPREITLEGTSTSQCACFVKNYQKLPTFSGCKPLERQCKLLEE